MNYQKKTFWFIFIVSLLCIPLFVSGNITNLKFNYLSTEDGLSHYSANCIKQDDKGFMWLGTEHGLNKYDGYTFTIYEFDPNDSTSLSNNYIKDLCFDSSQTLWVATEKGVNKFLANTNSFQRYMHSKDDTNSLCGNEVYAICEKNDNELWFGTQNGLNLFNKKTEKFRHIRLGPENKNTMGNFAIWSLYKDSKGLLP